MPVLTDCSACGEMVEESALSLQPNGYHLCNECLELIRDDREDRREEIYGSTCNAGCGYCGRCS